MIEIEKFDRDFFCDKDKDKLFKELSRLKKENCVFRGISKKEQFLPSLMRKELQKVEIELLEQLEMKGQFLHNNSNYMDFLTSAQHYGLPTRLLDFSYNPYVALFFALYKENAEEEFYNIIYCSLTENIVFKNLPKIIRINNSNANSFSSDLRDAYSAINEIGDSDSSLRNYLYSAVYNLTYKGENLESDENINKIKKEDLRNKLIFLRAKNANLRIAMQEGLFLFSNTTNEKEYLKILQKNTKLLCIHKNLRKDLLDELKIMGITEEKIMPDLQSLCFAIIEQFTKKLSVKK